ncbi:MAG: hypothetical protein GTO40_17400 [Deltaproteobacteria bacterium]|nr:hypothetical protein [Deltaproteobacteria bacterium]
MNRLIKEHGWTTGIEVGVGNQANSRKLIEANPGLSLTGVDIKVKSRFSHPRYQNVQSDSELYGLSMKETVDFVFIDADHSYPSVIRDILAYQDKCTFLSGHDYCEKWPGVMAAVDELIPDRKLGPDGVWYR